MEIVSNVRKSRQLVLAIAENQNEYKLNLEKYWIQQDNKKLMSPENTE